MDYFLERKMPLWVRAFRWSGVETDGRLAEMSLQTLPAAKEIAKECLAADNVSTAWIVNTRGDRLLITRRTR
jgi:hypothetical protein